MKQKQNKKKIFLKTLQETKRHSEDTTTKQKAQPTQKCVWKHKEKKTERQRRCFCVVHLWAADMETSSYMSMTRCCFGACTSCAAWLHTEVHKGKKNMLAIILKLLLTAGDANNKEGISTNQTGKSTANTLYMWEHILLDVNGI